MRLAMAPSVFRLPKILLLSFHRVQAAAAGPSGACGGRGEKRCQGQIPCKQLHMPGPPISLSIPFILKMLQKFRDISRSRIVPCLCLFLSELTGCWVCGTEVWSTWCSDRSQMKCVLWQDFCFWIIIHHKEWLSVRAHDSFRSLLLRSVHIAVRECFDLFFFSSQPIRFGVEEKLIWEVAHVYWY